MYIFDNYNPCGEKSAILSCCLSFLQYDSPAHAESLDI